MSFSVPYTFILEPCRIKGREERIVLSYILVTVTWARMSGLGAHNIQLQNFGFSRPSEKIRCLEDL